MQRVDGIGGFFFKAVDAARRCQAGTPSTSAIGGPPETYEAEVWMPAGGPDRVRPVRPRALGEPVPRTDVAGASTSGSPTSTPSSTQLRASGIEVEVDPETYPNGRFASLHDPEGNAIQLWQAA